MQDMKHQFLKQKGDCEVDRLSSNVLDRIISRGLGQQERPEHSRIPLLRMVNSEPIITCSDVNVITANVAFGRWAIPKIKKELLNHDPETAKNALTSLLDLVHDPEKAVEAVRLNVIPRLVRPMRNKDPFVRQQVLLILHTLAMQPAGKMAVVNNKIIMNQLAEILGDEIYGIRNSATKTLLSLATWYFAVKELINKNFIEIVIRRLNLESNDDIKVCLLQILELLLDQDMPAKKEGLQAYNIDFNYLLGPNSLTKVRAGAAAVLTQLLKHPDGKASIIEQNKEILVILSYLLEDEDVMVKTHAAGALMFLLCTTEAKLICLKLHTLKRLLRCAHIYLAPGLQMNALKALTSLAESPQGRATLRRDLDEVLDIRPADSIANRHKRILIKVINHVV